MRWLALHNVDEGSKINKRVCVMLLSHCLTPLATLWTYWKLYWIMLLTPVTHCTISVNRLQKMTDLWNHESKHNLIISKLFLKREKSNLGIKLSDLLVSIYSISVLPLRVRLFLTSPNLGHSRNSFTPWERAELSHGINGDHDCVTK